MAKEEYILTKYSLTECSKIVYGDLNHYTSDASVEAELKKGAAKSTPSTITIDDILNIKKMQVSPEKKKLIEVRTGQFVAYRGRPQERTYDLTFLVEVNGLRKVVSVMTSSSLSH